MITVDYRVSVLQWVSAHLTCSLLKKNCYTYGKSPFSFSEKSILANIDSITRERWYTGSIITLLLDFCGI